MSNPNYVWTLTGAQLQAGNAINNTQTDHFQVYGEGNDIVGIGGNLVVTGAPSHQYLADTKTSIELKAASGVTDTICLDGGQNELIGVGKLSNANISYTVTGNAGSNTVSLYNAGGHTKLNLGGPNNTMTLNGDATNCVTSTGGKAQVTVGAKDDNRFGYATSITLGGVGNVVHGGDENFSVSGGQGSVTLGDGTNAVSMTGAGNQVTVGGGRNTINAGGDNAVVNILGVDSTGRADWKDHHVPSSPTDDVTIAGKCDKVSATYENVNIWGAAVTSAATIQLGDGNNSVVLGGTGGNKVTVGNGANIINASGNSSTYNLGWGPNGVTLSGNDNNVNVTDAKGMGLDNVQLGAGENNNVKFDHAGGSVAGTDTKGMTTVTQAGLRVVDVDLHWGSGNISLGDGCDTVRANGANTVINAGQGDDDVTADGGNDKITLGNGNNSVQANGKGDTLSFGNGNNDVCANSDNDKMSFGSGSNTVSALGAGDSITLAAVKAAVNKVTVGSNDSVQVTNGTALLTANGAGDSFCLNNTNLGTVVNAYANNEQIALGSNASAFLHLNPAGAGESIMLSGSGVSGHDYCGTVEMTGFGPADHIDLSKLMGANGQMLDTMTNIVSNFSAGPTCETLHLHGGGSIVFDSPVTFTAAEFKLLA